MNAAYIPSSLSKKIKKLSITNHSDEINRRGILRNSIQFEYRSSFPFYQATVPR